MIALVMTCRRLTSQALSKTTSAPRCVVSSRICSYSHSSRRSDKVGRDSKGHIYVHKLLATPTWSVAALLPSGNTTSDAPEISDKQFEHLLRLSALPSPQSAEEKDKMLSTLASQLQFVREIQKTDTTGIEPLRSLRDETTAGEKEAELGMDALKTALETEVVKGKYHKRIRRRRDVVVGKKEDAWDPLATATRKVGQYFVVEGGVKESERDGS